MERREERIGERIGPAPGAMADGVPCPFCQGSDTRLLSPFGGQISVAQYWCRRCRTGFDYMKWEDSAAPG